VFGVLPRWCGWYVVFQHSDNIAFPLYENESLPGYFWEKKKKEKKKKAGFTILFSKVILRVLVRAIFLCDH